MSYLSLNMSTKLTAHRWDYRKKPETPSEVRVELGEAGCYVSLKLHEAIALVADITKIINDIETNPNANAVRAAEGN